VGRKMAGMRWHVGFLRSALSTLEVVFRYLRRQLNQKITLPDLTLPYDVANVCFKREVTTNGYTKVNSGVSSGNRYAIDIITELGRLKFNGY
jgi:hypothetical protein